MKNEISGTRYPVFGIITGGSGAFNEGLSPQPYETFAYDLALKQAAIENFNIIPYTSVLPPEVRGHLVTVTDQTHRAVPYLPYRAELTKQFHHGAVLEAIMAGQGAEYTYHKAIATGIGIVWACAGKEFIGGFAAEYVQLYDTRIDNEIARAEASLWLNKSLNHELSIRGLKQEGEKEIFHNYINIPSDNPYAYCLSCIGFLNFAYAPPVSM